MAYLKGKQVVIPNLYATLTPRGALSAPSISISGSTLTITDTNEVDVIFNILVNDAVRGRTTENTFDLSTIGLEDGNYEISVFAMAMGYTDSPESEVLPYVVKKTFTLSGTWVFDEKAAADEFPATALGEEVYFTAAGFDYDCIDQQGWGDITGPIYAEIGWCRNGNISSVYAIYPDVHFVGSEELLVVTFDGAQMVSQELYEWVIANAVPVITNATVSVSTNEKADVYDGNTYLGTLTPVAGTATAAKGEFKITSGILGIEDYNASNLTFHTESGGVHFANFGNWGAIKSYRASFAITGDGTVAVNYGRYD